MSLRFKPKDKAFLNNKEVVISKRVKNYSTGITKYVLESGETVSDDQLDKVSNILHAATKEAKSNMEDLAKDISEVAEKASEIQIEEIKPKSKKKNFSGAKDNE